MPGNLLHIKAEMEDIAVFDRIIRAFNAQLAGLFCPGLTIMGDIIIKADGLGPDKAALTKKTRGGDKQAAADLALMETLFAGLSDGLPARAVEGLSAAEAARLPQLQLLTAKPVLYVCNVAEEDSAEGNALSAKVALKAAAEDAGYVIVSAAIEAEIATLSDAEAAEFLADLGLAEPGLNRLIRAGYGLPASFAPASPLWAI